MPSTDSPNSRHFSLKPLVLCFATVSVAATVSATESRSIETIVIHGQKTQMDLRAEQMLTPGRWR